MISTFFDELQPEAHSLFQGWRLDNPDGFFLAQKRKGSYLLHHVGCHHIGSPFWDGTPRWDAALSNGAVSKPGGNHSLTSSQKICAPAPNELLAWLVGQGFVHSICRHCVDASNPSHLKSSASAKQRMDEWVSEGGEDDWPFPPRESIIQTEAEAEENNWLFQEELSTDTPLFEGARLIVQVSAFERNPIARQKCIAHYGTSCSVCGFNFGAAYGSAAENYIHAHHLKPLASIGEEYAIDPIKDLRPVCANCHAVIHMRQPPYSIEEVKDMLHGGTDAYS